MSPCSMVREKGLEPSRPEALAPKASVSTNSTTRARIQHYSKFPLVRKVAYGMIGLINGVTHEQACTVSESAFDW